MTKRRKHGILLILTFPIMLVLMLIWNEYSHWLIPTGCLIASGRCTPAWADPLRYTLEALFFASIPLSIYGIWLTTTNSKNKPH